MSKFVVYTVLTGDKEELGNPFLSNSSGFERICFTDNPNLNSKDWDILLLDDHGLKPERESRRPKLLPHRYLQDFSSSLYIDNTVTLKCNPIEIENEYINSNPEKDFFCFAHPSRKCIYDEGEVVIQYGIDEESRVREQLDFYASRGYPKINGLIAGTMLLRRHLEPESIEFHEIWFEHVCRYSKRDQISFNFISWLKNFQYSCFYGSLLSNSYMDWHPGLSPRLPRDFDETFYTWLNPAITAQNLDPRKHYLEVGIHQKRAYKRFAWDLNYLANKYKTDKGDFYYNRHAYAAVYQKYLGFLKTKSFKLLEIGLLRHDVQAINPTGPYADAPSLNMWSEYFPNAKIYGFDIADFSAFHCTENIEIIRGDASKVEDLESLVCHINDRVDVIIDDASHASHHQQIALSVLFQYLRNGGYYIIEDLHYQPKQLEISGTPKTQYILSELCKGNLVQSDYLQEPVLEYLQDNVEFIHFYDSQDRNFGDLYRDNLAVIKKKVQTTQTVCLCIFLDWSNSSHQIYESLREILLKLVFDDQKFKVLLYVNEEFKAKTVNFIDGFKAFWLINEQSKLDDIRFFVVNDYHLNLWSRLPSYYLIFIFKDQSNFNLHLDCLESGYPLLVLGNQSLLILPDWKTDIDGVAQEIFDAVYQAHLQVSKQPLNILISTQELTREFQQEFLLNLIFSLTLEYDIDMNKDLIISPIPYLEPHNWSILSAFFDSRSPLSSDNHKLLENEFINCLPVKNP